jgi:hypothetical protein
MDRKTELLRMYHSGSSHLKSIAIHELYKLETEERERMGEDTIAIPVKEYESLQRKVRKLALLEGHGADNWQGYSAALREFYAEEGEE